MSEPLRVCRDCGLEAWTEKDLELFVKNRYCFHGRRPFCKRCRHKAWRETHPEIKLPYLRKCRVCGLEAKTNRDLNHFRKRKNSKYEYDNICTNCDKLQNKARYKKIRLHVIYLGMKQRCYNEKHIQYEQYGGRGIYICEEWLRNEEFFRDWAKNNGYTPTLQVDRVDNDGPYAPWNCRWTTHKVQALNRRYNVTNLEKGTRICCRCKIEKPFSEFHRSTGRGDNGYRFMCKLCLKEYRRELKLKHEKATTIAI